MAIQPRTSRPSVPKGYGLLPPNEGSGLLSWNWVVERMVNARNYWIVTTSPDGAPHVMPVWGLWMNRASDGQVGSQPPGAVYFSTARDSRKARNIDANSRMAVHLESGDEVVVLEGHAEEVADAATLKDFVDAYLVKYQTNVEVSPEALANSPVIRLRLRKAFAWTEKDYPGGATRWQFP